MYTAKPWNVLVLRDRSCDQAIIWGISPIGLAYKSTEAQVEPLNTNSAFLERLQSITGFSVADRAMIRSSDGWTSDIQAPQDRTAGFGTQI